MKKLILVSTAILLSFGSFAQTDSTNNKMNHDIMNHDMDNSMNHQTMDKSHPNGVMMKDGKMMMIHNGKMTMMNHDMTMSNGTKVMSDGTCIKKDGIKMMMKEGQHMDMSGKMIPMKNYKMKKEDDSKKDNKY